METSNGGRAVAWFLYFAAASFLGWILESAYKSLKEGRWVNSGFLSGPFVPVYGFGALSIAALARVLDGAPPALAWACLVLAPSAVEYIAAWLLERTLALRIWDYRRLPLNLHGRICLGFSLCWAALTAGTVLYAEPLLLGRILSLTDRTAYFAAGALAMYFWMDAVASVRSFVNFAAFVADLRELIARGGSFLPSFELGRAKLPREIRRLLKPLKAFPHLAGELRPLAGAIPEWITDRLSSILGARHFRP